MLEKTEPLEEVQQLFEEWRRNKKRRDQIPGALWEAAVSLSRHLSAHRIAKLLHLNHTAVRDHIRAHGQDEGIRKKDSPFIELDVIPPASAVGECVIEVEKQGGAKLRISFKGNCPDMIGLAKALWGEA